MTTAESTEATGEDVVKWYTRARRFPKLVGRTHDGLRLPGGPYTITQIVGGIGFFLLAAKTMGLWGQWGFIGNLLLLFASSYGVMWSLGRLPLGARNPLAVLWGLCNSAASPRGGRYRGHSVRLPPTTRCRGRVVVMLTDPSHLRTGTPTSAADPEAHPLTPSPSERIEQEPRPSEPVVLTGLQELMARSTRPERTQ